MFVLPDLPYAYGALEPIMSDRTLRFHHDKHHAAYVAALNDALRAAEAEPRTLELVIEEAAKGGDHKLFNNAAQAWNHSFFWLAMTPSDQQPGGDLAAAIDKTFGDLAGLEKAFVEAGVGHFGSGWVWLVADANGALSVRATHDADDTLSQPGVTPLLVCDLWEHAYYLDRQNDRKGFLESWLKALANWDFAAEQFAAARGQGTAWRHPIPV